MRPARASGRPGRQRPGKILVLFALLLPMLMAMAGLVIDGGLMFAGFRLVGAQPVRVARRRPAPAVPQATQPT